MCACFGSMRLDMFVCFLLYAISCNYGNNGGLRTTSRTVIASGQGHFNCVCAYGSVRMCVCVWSCFQYCIHSLTVQITCLHPRGRGRGEPDIAYLFINKRHTRNGSVCITHTHRCHALHQLPQFTKEQNDAYSSNYSIEPVE